jgi:hypothetical protein
MSMMGDKNIGHQRENLKHKDIPKAIVLLFDGQYIANKSKPIFQHNGEEECKWY